MQRVFINGSQLPIKITEQRQVNEEVALKIVFFFNIFQCVCCWYWTFLSSPHINTHH